MNADQDTLPSAVPDIGDIPLDAAAEVSDDEYAWILCRAGVTAGIPAATAGAFQSSI